MSLFIVMLVIVLIGMALYAINLYVPMDGKIKKILNIATVVLLVLWLIKVSGLWSYLNSIHI